MSFDKKTILKASGFFETFHEMPVVTDWQHELYNYIIHGLPPGSFHTACFANDLLEAAIHSHVANDWESIQTMMRWLHEYAPDNSWGSYDKVTNWIKMDKKEREKICYKLGFLITDEEVTWKLLEEENP